MQQQSFTSAATATARVAPAITSHQIDLSAGTIEYLDTGGEGSRSCCCTA